VTAGLVGFAHQEHGQDRTRHGGAPSVEDPPREGRDQIEAPQRQAAADSHLQSRNDAPRDQAIHQLDRVGGTEHEQQQALFQ
jgi:hypothetical protein